MSWYHTSWNKRKRIEIAGYVATPINYQHRIDVTYDADMQADFDDIRFTDSDDITELDYWCESYVASTSAIFWVKVPAITTDPYYIYMYYGNSLVSSASNGTNTNVFFCDFDTLDLDIWDINYGNANIVSDGGVAALRIYENTDVVKTISFSVVDGIIIRARCRATQPGAYNADLIGPAIATVLSLSSLHQGFAINLRRQANDPNYLRVYINEDLVANFPTGGTGYATTDTSIYHILETQMDSGDGSNFYDNDILKASSVTGSSTNMYLHIWGYNISGAYQYCDWILIRTYTSDTLVNTFETEESRPGVQLRFRRRARSTADKSISYTELLLQDNNEPLTISRVPEEDVPRSVVITYKDPIYNFDQVSQRFENTTSESTREEQLNYPMVLSTAAARNIVRSKLRLLWVSRNAYKFQLSWKYLYLDSTDILELTDADGFVHRIIITRELIGQNGALDIEAAYEKFYVYPA